MFAVELFMYKNHTELWFIILLQNYTVHVAHLLFGAGIPAREQGEKVYIKATLEKIFL